MRQDIQNRAVPALKMGRESRVTKLISGLAGGGLLFLATQASLGLFPAYPPAAIVLLLLAGFTHGAFGFLRIGGYEAWLRGAGWAAALCMALAAAVTAVSIPVSWAAGRVVPIQFEHSTNLTLACACLAGLLVMSLHAFRQARRVTAASF